VLVLNVLLRLLKFGFQFSTFMDETLKQLGGLLLGSIPTVIFMVLIYAAYSVIVHKPLSKVLAERHDRTEGAVAKAKADISAAEARTAEYEQRLREARSALFKAEEAKRQQAAQVRAAAVAEGRSVAQARVAQERAAIAEEAENAQGALQAQSQALAAKIVETVLRPVAGGVR
jgi:F-type H+-transporting ATPase subunit b